MKAVSAIFCALAAAASVAASSDVHVLTKDNFDSIAEKPLSLIEFYAPWCGHCKSLAPEYEKAATELKASLPLAKVDCTEQTELCEKHDIKGYPTLKVFREGVPSEYKGQRKADGIVSYMKKQNLPPVSILTADKVEEFSTSDKVVLVGFFADKASSEFAEFEKVAKELREEFLFGAAVDKAAAEKFKVTAPALVLYKKFDEGKATFSGAFKHDEIAQFLRAESVPTMDEIGPENYAKYVESGIPLAYLFYSSEAERKSPGADIEAIAKEYKGKLNFVYIDAQKFGGHAKNLNVKEQWPAFAIQEPAQNVKYPFDQSKSLTKANVKSFVDEYLAGKLQPSLKSEAVPEKNDGPVKVIVGKNWDDVVLNKSADVLVEFYAPWCGHCKALAPTWEKLGEAVGSDKIVIAKMDATENDIAPGSGFTIEGFPTIKLFKAKTNEIVDYDGERSIDGFVSFLKKNAVHADEIKDVNAAEAEGTSDAHDHEGHEEL
ncbi:uncharacterized protein EV422DRAFT_510902 [Fimicolochytrium jonesii]|uniref:uncharacterized protein n=1 Tax=Fimicolochytrium jonesii TaxID=1396493 RepID=UPI0022FF1EF3|nr:uncharacterized protein EV422DRAFT_510902 [Fimicolochytrium jonesii]KAI8826628.1 hypothetical protein EV422DRAFT_510902 [Fimicolochytrium jonesii]